MASNGIGLQLTAAADAEQFLAHPDTNLQNPAGFFVPISDAGAGGRRFKSSRPDFTENYRAAKIFRGNVRGNKRHLLEGQLWSRLIKGRMPLLQVLKRNPLASVPHIAPFGCEIGRASCRERV